jgi:hypothetical protein
MGQAAVAHVSEDVVKPHTLPPRVALRRIERERDFVPLPHD